MRLHARWAVAATIALLLIPTTAVVAQMGLRTVRGVVRDSAGEPIDQVRVLALSAGRTARTDAAGRFRLDSMPVGEERFLFRRVGFNPVETMFMVGLDDADLVVRLAPSAEQLTPVVVHGRRSGVLGVIMDIQSQPLADAEVLVLGGASATRTDSLGRFSLPGVPAGTFMLMVRKKGYHAARQSVRLPVGEALDVSWLLAPVPSGLSNRMVSRLAGFGGIMDLAWDQHASRRVRCSGGNAVFVPREELAEQGTLRLDMALPRAASALSRGFGPEELRTFSLFIDGQTATGWPLSAISADEVEAVEVYRGMRSRTRRDVISSVSPVGCPSGTVWVWLR
jgi:hypothetical protein